MEQDAPGQQIVDVVVVRPISGDPTVGVDLRVHKARQMVEPPGLPGRLVKQTQPLIDAAVLVAPRSALVGPIPRGVSIEIVHQHRTVAPWMIV